MAWRCVQLTLYENFRILKSRTGYPSQRLFAELSFADAYNSAYNCGFDAQILQQAEMAVAIPCPTMDDVISMEKALSELCKLIKTFKVLTIAHSHIDMNWMWSFNETVSITLSTFRTVLDLMNEYPDFTFGQSQASVYRIVEKYDPDMLDEIRARVKEGRWELAVSSWVETDKNLPSGETLCRHILYSKQYMAELFGVDPDSLQLDFEPDTFGHNANVPQILSAGGVKYYYHCRGYEGHHIYRWRSDNSEILCYREPVWYNAHIEYDDYVYMPKFARENNLSTMLKVYGIGDHGGGPTRRDLSRLLDMRTWPLMPDIQFGTYHQFYDYLDSIRHQLPVISGELNAFSTGCYTTQTRIKRFNKVCELQLYESEVFDALNTMHGSKQARGAAFSEAWEHVLFNDFHDIIPGSGVIDTREHALGRYQECLAITASRKMKALSELAAKIDTSHYQFPNDDESVSFGAGVGYCHTAGIYGFPDRNNTGRNRIYHLFNSTSTDCTTPSVLTIWDYPGNLNDVRLFVLGKPVAHQLLDVDPVFYWDHLYQRIAVDARVPAFGYTTLVLRPNTEGSFPYPFPSYPRLDWEDAFVLENELLRVELDTMDCTILRMIDKRTGKDVIDHKSCYFRLISEDASKEMTAWIVGRYKSIQNLTENVIVHPRDYIRGELVQSITYAIDFSDSRLKVTMRLEKNCPYVKFSCTCDFGEKPVVHHSVPQLSVYIPCTVTGSTYTADIPFGKINRAAKRMDMPTLNGVMVDTGKGNLFVMSNSKYGFRTTDEGISVTLIRSSYEPDPLPDYGVSEFDFAIGVAADTIEYDRLAQLYNHPCSEVPVIRNGGTIPEEGRLLEVMGAKISAVKQAEDGNGYIFRLYDCTEVTKLKLPFPIARASICDLCEKNVAPLFSHNNEITFHSAGGIVTVRIEKE